MVKEKIKLSKSSLLCCLWIAGILLFIFRHYYFVSIPIITGFILFAKLQYKDKLIILSVICISVLSLLLRESDELKAERFISSFPDKHLITAEIVKRTDYSGGYSKYDIEVKSIEYTKANINAIVYLTDKLIPGQFVSIQGELSEIPSARNPYAFNRKLHYRNKGILLQIRSAKLDRILYHKYNYNFLIHKIHTSIQSKIRNSFGDHSNFVMAILLGDKSGIENYDEYTEAGTNHLLAMSGLHLGLIAVIFSSLLALFVRNRKQINIIVIFLLLVYASICGWSPSVTRAFLMISLFLVSKVLVRKVSVQDIFYSAVLLILIINPYELFMIGFQFSITAVFALIFILPVIVKNIGLSRLYKQKQHKKIIAVIISLILSSMVIMAFHFPITYYHFSSVNFNGLLANLVSIPLFSAIILPYAMLMLISPTSISEFLSPGFDILMSIFTKLTQLFSELPFNLNFLRFSPILFTVLLLSAVCFTLLFIFRNRNNIKAVRTFLISFIPIVFFSVYIVKEQSVNSDFDRISFFDVGSGDACLIELENGSNIMIDTGRKDFSGNIAYNVFPYMKHYGIKHINHLIITHAHDDHYGGFEKLTENCNIDTLITTQSVINTIKEEFPNSELPQTIIVKDTCSFRYGDAIIKILHPSAGYCDENENNMSITCLLSLKRWNFLFTGDIEKEAEDILSAKYGDAIQSDFLKVPHHGSGTSSTPEFLQKVNPEFAYIPDGFRNRFGFPSKKVLYNLQQEGIKYFSGSQDGFMQINVHEDSLCFETFISDKKKRYLHNSNIK